MGAGVVTVGRRQYAAGLYWENSPSGRLAQTAKEAAKQPGQQADFYALRSGNKNGRVPQFGLGLAAAGHKPGMPAFAACLANQQPGSWGGAFRLREGTVVTIVRDDLIVPDGDQFFTNEAEARDRLLQEIGFGGLQRIYAPEAWSISGVDTMPPSLLMNDNRDVKLRPVEVSRKLVIAGVAGVALLLVLLGGGWYWNEQQAEEEAQRQAQEDALRRLRDQVNKANVFQEAQPQYPPPERLWEKQPPALAMVESCHTGLAQVPASVAGWNLTKLICDGHVINLTWTREVGLSRPPEDSLVNDSGTQAVRSVVLPALTPRGPENLVDPAEVTARFLGQNWQGSLQRGADDPPPQAPAGFQGAWAPPPPPWLKRSFTVNVPDLPSDLSVYFGDLPGTVINSLSYSLGSDGGTWMVDGVIYENRK